MMHICTKCERNLSRNVACRAHTRYPPKYDLWPYKRRNTGGSITKNNKRVEFTKIHLHTKFERKPSRNAFVRAHTRMWTKLVFPDMCGCHGNAWRSSSENSIFHNAMLYWFCVPEVTGSRIFPQKMLLPWQRWLRPHPKTIGVFALP